MISMTGFGRSDFQIGGRLFRIEARSFNNRFLDVKIRLPWIDGELESRCLALVRRKVSRGRIDISAFEERGGRTSPALYLDEALALSLGETLRRLASLLQSDLATASRVLPPLKELVGLEGPMATDTVWPALETALETALAALAAMRQKEGQSLAADVAGHLQRIRELTASIRAVGSGEPERARRRLEERLQRLLGETAVVDPARLAEEVALLADRSDISEELARLDSHIEQLQEMLQPAGEVGRRLEFLLQEFHRELNTITSKADNAEISHLVVEAKASVERMREQAQNVE